MSESLLEISSVSKAYGGSLFSRTEPTVVLREFDLAFSDGDARIVALAGESGSGKTTAANITLGLARPSGGEVRYRGRPLGGLAGGERRRFRREVQAILQDPYGAFNPFYRVHHVFDVAARNFQVAATAEARGAAIAGALDFVGLAGERVLGRYPHELSGGERQRLMIARAFMLGPKLIVADEPVSMIDASLRASILEVILRLRAEAGISFLYITHDLSTAYHIADELLVMRRGEIVERGPSRTVIDAPSHEYTRRLVGAVPVPDPSVRWAAPPQ